jgi:phosphopantetheine--protein transferase-like protein
MSQRESEGESERERVREGGVRERVRETPVLRATAEVAEPPTAFVFTGQGSQTVGMGMALFDSSPAAAAVWRTADAHLRAKFGFSLLAIVRSNPRTLVVHFGGKRGAAIRRNYMNMRYERVGPLGEVQHLPLFPTVTATSRSHTFVSPLGLLSATQFTQPALVLMETAAFADLRSAGVAPPDSPFAGHSLGEYAALAAIGEVLPTSVLVEVCFYRGMTMQVAVPRDDQGSSDYGMVAASPARVGTGFSEAALEETVKLIVETRKRERVSEGEGEGSVGTEPLLQIVNYNIEGDQYVLAGDLVSLQALTNVLDGLVRRPTADRASALVAAVGAAETAGARAGQASRRLRLTRGKATVPLPGISVPFHSSYLLPGVAPFRAFLRDRIQRSFVDVRKLEHRYIPNVTARPFAVTKEYVELVASTTGSPLLSDLLAEWEEERTIADPAGRQRVAHLLLIELLAYQFASPVRWIETQDVLLGELAVERLVEIGPAPTLAGMAKKTIALKYREYDEAVTFRRTVLSYTTDDDELYYRTSQMVTGDEEEGGSEEEEEEEATATATPVPVATPAPAPPQPVPTQASASSSLPPLRPSLSLPLIIAQVSKQDPTTISSSTTIKTLSAGKSTVANEILGKCGAEFGKMWTKVEEGAGESEIGTLGRKMDEIAGVGGHVGPSSSGAVAAWLADALPGGMSVKKVKAYLEARFGVAAQGGGKGTSLSPVQTGILFTAAIQSGRSRLASEEAVHAVLDAAVTAYAAAAGVAVPTAGGGAVAAAPPAANVVAAGATAGPAAPVPDGTLSPLRVLQGTVAATLAVPVASVAGGESLKSLAGGKSTVQNEWIGGLSAEFGRAWPEGAEDMSLDALAAALSATGSYTKHGPTVSRIVARYLERKLPGGFSRSAAERTLTGLGLGPLRREAAIFEAACADPSPTAPRWSSPAEAQAALAAAASAHAAGADITLGQAGGAAGAVSPASTSASSGVLSGAAAERLRQLFRDTLELYAAYLDEPLHASSATVSDLTDSLAASSARLDSLTAELGSDLVDGIVPLFDEAKVRTYDSYWNWVRQDGMALLYDIVAGRITRLDRDVVTRSIHMMNRATREICDHMRWEVERCCASQGRNYDVVCELGHQLLANVERALNDPPLCRDVRVPTRPSLTFGERGQLHYEEVPSDLRRLEAWVKSLLDHPRASPFLSLPSTTRGAAFDRCDATTDTYAAAMHDLAAGSTTFCERTALLTGVGSGSIGQEILVGLLSGGATVVATTSSSSASTRFRAIYERHGSKGSKLFLVPMNGASRRDVLSLVAFIYGKLGLDLDIVVPFAAMAEGGIEVPDIGSRSELAHRLMLTNVNVLLGAVAAAKRDAGSLSRPAQVLLPLSPNHGVFGGDGLYSESKAGLAMLLNKWSSESWSPFLSLVGAVIGWTRGTGLMNANNLIAPGLEEAVNILTFSPQEMGFLLLAALDERLEAAAAEHPLVLDVTGGMGTVPNLAKLVTDLRQDVLRRSEVAKALADEAEVEAAEVAGAPWASPASSTAARLPPPPVVKHRPCLTFSYPPLPAATADIREPFRRLPPGLLDLADVYVIVGFGEVGPFGSARTRWEAEVGDGFSDEGLLELAWVMGFITFVTDKGWTDAESGEPVDETDLRATYGDRILAGVGVRLIEPEVTGFDPTDKLALRQVAVDRDLKPLEMSAEEAERIKAQHGDKVTVFRDAEGIIWVQLLQGAVLYIPKSVSFDRLVAGQLPTGWSATRYGIPADIVAQVDPVSLYTLVATMEAFATAGITDPYELWQWLHVSEVGNTIGGGVGGMRSTQAMYRERFLGVDIPPETLQESFINTMGAWVNMLLLSASGPITAPVGACATAAQSLDLAVELLRSKRAKLVISGAHDDFREEGSREFGALNATSSAVDEAKLGRTPKEMSRPMTASRSGFMEAHGAGVQIVTTAALALAHGLPIHAIVGTSLTATDKVGRSVPAPGQGLLGAARQRPFGTNPLLNPAWRAKQLSIALASVKEWTEASLLEAGSDASAVFHVQASAASQVAAARRYWSKDCLAATSVSPWLAGLATYGLTIDDVDLASLHGTSTRANDTNEPAILQEQLRHLGRSTGAALPCVTQKALTGHPKGPAFAWMLHSVCQSFATGIVPGNANLDNVEPALRAHAHLYFPSRKQVTDGLTAAVLGSHGFGHVSAFALVVHPDIVFAQLDDASLAEYAAARTKRHGRTYRHYHDALAGKRTLFRAKDAPPYTDAQQSDVLLDPTARAAAAGDSYSFGSWKRGNATDAEKAAGALATTLAAAATATAGTQGASVGVDVQLIADLSLDPTFIERNFSEAERHALSSSADRRSTAAGRWAAKEAVFKAVSLATGLPSRGAGAALTEVEVGPPPARGLPPTLTLHGSVRDAVADVGATVSVSISHSGEYAVAVATCTPPAH